MQYYARGGSLPLFPDFWKAGIVLTIMTVVFPKRIREYLKGFFFIIESLPDIFVILLAQIGVVCIYKQTDLLLYNLTSGFDEKAIVLPIFILSLLPSVYIFKYLLLAISIPVLALYIQNELDALSNKEYIDSAKIMSGSHSHIFRKHLAPFLYPKLLILFVQQIGQVLIIFAHLGLLNVFIGGTDVRVIDYDMKKGEETTQSFSMSNEWAGLIAQNSHYAQSFPWVVLAPVLTFALSIPAINSIVYWINESQNLTKTRGESKLI